jgi:GTPase SAR1 family protein
MGQNMSRWFKSKEYQPLNTQDNTQDSLRPETYEQMKSEEISKKAQQLFHHKICVFGPSGSGKTRLSRALAGLPELKLPDGTIGVNYFKKTADNTHLHIWDTAGRSVYSSLWPVYLQGSGQILLVFNKNDRTTFDNLSDYYRRIKQITPDANIVLIGMTHNPDVGSEISEQDIQTFMREYPVQDYRDISANQPSDITDLQKLLTDSAHAHFLQNEDHAIEEAKELAKTSIELLRNRASNEDPKHQEKINRICTLLDRALLAEDMNTFFNENAGLLHEQMQQLFDAKSSLYTSAYNTVVTVLVCCAILVTGFTALHWLNAILEDNRANRGDRFMFLATGAKQLAKEAIHKISDAADEQKNKLGG